MPRRTPQPCTDPHLAWPWMPCEVALALGSDMLGIQGLPPHPPVILLPPPPESPSLVATWLPSAVGLSLGKAGMGTSQKRLSGRGRSGNREAAGRGVLGPKSAGS